jgi:replicative DNA helicase
VSQGPTERGLPGSWDTERALLGCLLMNTEALDEIRGFLRPTDFHNPAHGKLYRVVCEMVDRGVAVNEISVGARLDRAGKADEVGGLAYLHSLTGFVRFTEHAVSHAREIAQDAERRSAILKLRELEQVLLTDPSVEPAAAMARLQDTLDREVRLASDEWVSLADASAAAVAEIQRRVTEPAHVPGIPTGWPDLDRLIGGWRPSRVYVLGARPKMGKSSWIEQTAIHAGRLGHGVGLISLEMDRLELAERALAQEARVDAGRILRGELDDEAYRRIVDADDALARLPLFVSDRPAQTMAQVRASAKRLRRKCELAGARLGLLIIDYLQLMGGDAERGVNREQVIAGISRGVKLLAKEMEIPILVLSQLSRKLEERGDKRPVPSDLRESGALEQDADAVMFLYRDEVYNPNGPNRGICEVIVRAVRGGQPGTVKLAFIGNEYRFATLEHRQEEPPPSLFPEAKRRRRKGGGRPDGADPSETPED